MRRAPISPFGFSLVESRLRSEAEDPRVVDLEIVRISDLQILQVEPRLSMVPRHLILGEQGEVDFHRDFDSFV